jgi:hypothetical protein
MNEMIERVRDAIKTAHADGHQPQWLTDTCAEAMARAAIGALHEPTAAMLKAAWVGSGVYEGVDAFYTAVWQDMIDAALANDTRHPETEKGLPPGEDDDF